MKIELEGQVVFVRLTNDAVGALHDLVPSGVGFSAWVAAEKPYGLWLDPEGRGASDRLVLVKWGHLQTVTLMNPGTKPTEEKKK